MSTDGSWRSNNLLSVLLIAILVSSGGCDLINPSDPVPAYLYIDEFRLQTTPDEGSSSQLITEAWLYVNGDLQGAYSLPTRVAVLAEGNADILIFPGIRDNGIKSTPDLYPFYEEYQTAVDLQLLETDTVRPITTYKGNLIFQFIEDFESGNIFTDDEDADPQTRMVRSQDAFEGTQSGLMRLTTDNPVNEVATAPIFTTLPSNGTSVYLELDYQNSVPFTIGLIGHQSNLPETRQQFLTIRPKESWNKIYVNLTDAIRNSQLDGYQIWISAIHDLAEGSESTILLDNIKFLHFN